MKKIKPNQRILKKGERRNYFNITNNSHNSISNPSSNKHKRTNGRWRLNKQNRGNSPRL